MKMKNKSNLRNGEIDMRKVTNNNSLFVKIMAGVLAGLMVAGVFTTVIIMLVQ